MEKNFKIFLLFLLTNFFLNYDSGVIPASLLEITKEIALDYKEQALLGSLVYLGVSSASLYASPVISKYGAKKIIVISVLVNSFSTFIFSVSKIKSILFFTRFFMGMSQAFLAIYGPVWVNNFSPKNKSATWMGLMHSCSLFGLIFGYIIASFIINFLGNWINWRFSIQIQAIAEIPLIILIWMENEKLINIQLSTYSQVEIFEMQDNYYKLQKGNFTLEQKNKNNINNSNNENNENNINNNIENFNELNFQKSHSDQHNPNINMRLSNILDDGEHPLISYNLLSQIKIILQNKLYCLVTLALCSMYFVVTIIQFWMTSFLIQVLNANPVSVMFAFSFITATAPLSGILLGGFLSDKLGGYMGDNTHKAIKMATTFVFISMIFAFPVSFAYSLTYIGILIWAYLFFGSVIVPFMTGIMISCVPRQYQATSSSMSQLVFNLGGYFMAPFFTGFIMDFFEDEKEGFKWGMRIGFWWVICTECLLYLAYLESKKNVKSNNMEEINGDVGSDNDSLKNGMAFFVKMEIKRRMAMSHRL